MYKFKSRAASDLIMLEPNGRQILTIIGKDDAASADQGILLPAEMPQAILALEAAVVQEERKREQAAEEARARGETPPRMEGISLRQRAVPFIEMLRRCHKANKEIVWGV